MKKSAAALVCFLASTAIAQTGGYMGPGVLSSGAGTIGTRSGEQVDLRVYGDVQGVYDNGLEPYGLNSQGQLYSVNGLYGEQIDFGAYGQHKWRTALLGLDYTGNFYHYDNNSSFDGFSQFLSLGFTYQKSRKLSFNFRGTAGTTKYGFGQTNGNSESTVVGQPTELLFNNQVYFGQGGMDVTYLLSARTSVTAGGDGYIARYQAAGLIGMDGYNLRGSIHHRLTRRQTIGLNYMHMHYDFVQQYGYSNINDYELFYATSIGKRMTISVSAGAFQSQVLGVEQVALNSVIAALLGQTTGTQTFQAQNYNPAGTAQLTEKFKSAQLTLQYSETAVPGDGVYLTSRQDAGTLGYSYTGLHKWNLGVSGGYYKLGSLGQQFQPYVTYGGGGGFTYNLTRSFHLIGRYDYRRQEITFVGFRQNASRVTFGVAYSPGNIPLSLW